MPALFKSNYADAQRDTIIASALESPEGRVALAQATSAQPIRLNCIEKDCYMQEDPVNNV